MRKSHKKTSLKPIYTTRTSNLGRRRGSGVLETRHAATARFVEILLGVCRDAERDVALGYLGDDVVFFRRCYHHFGVGLVVDREVITQGVAQGVKPVFGRNANIVDRSMGIFRAEQQSADRRFHSKGKGVGFRCHLACRDTLCVTRDLELRPCLVEGGLQGDGVGVAGERGLWGIPREDRVGIGSRNELNWCVSSDNSTLRDRGECDDRDMAAGEADDDLCSATTPDRRCLDGNGEGYTVVIVERVGRDMKTVLSTENTRAIYIYIYVCVLILRLSTYENSL